ncbi:DNA polymerase alpha/epsilon subunit B-domain-containing protein [Crucibulum laeve]|uniref:DNA polymerase alpha subunit B n=1 Tax=Crucibulum laeve TaxID=68775 RepID=A0A5C3M7R4_9AGAR|nr:DNA polymerase alpha/epsilon subunit B-domain-containing protein [Crucibulum laeve]
METEIRAEILNTYVNAMDVSNEKLVTDCISMCQTYSMSAEDLLWKLEAINFKPSATYSEISPITKETIAILRTQLQRDLSSKVQVKPRQNANAMVNRFQMPPNMRRGMNVGMSTASPARTPSVKTEQVEDSIAYTSSSVVFKGPKSDAQSKKRRAYRYMYEKISERSEALDQVIDEFVELIRKHYDISDLGDPSLPTDKEITIVGRIVHDAELVFTSKLTEAALAIESSRMLSSGARIPLRLDVLLRMRGNAPGAGGFGLFPGAIVALRGKNGGGGYFLATEILAMPPLKASPTAQGTIPPKLDAGMGDSPISICVACGPFTPDADLEYKPWRALIKSLKTTKPKVLVLIGPFVDVAHPKIKAGDVRFPPVQMFKLHFLTPLKSFFDASPGSIVLIVPSVRDVISAHAVFPQPELEAELVGSDPRIHLLPNPSLFSINDITFGTTSVDTIFHLRKEEYIKRCGEIAPLAADSGDVDAMANSCRHLLQQRSFYPVFPVPLDLAHEVNLDVSHLEGLRLGGDDEGQGEEEAPDVLLLPSRLKQFVKNVHTTTAVNPSFLTKGTYAVLNIAPRSTPGGLKERLKVEIVKIEEQPPVQA